MSWRHESVLAFLLTVVMSQSASARTLVAGQDAKTLHDTIALATNGDVVEVPEGTWQGSFRVERSITLRGTGGVIDGNQKGTVLVVDAPNVRLESLKVQGSGSDLGAPDCCIYLTPKASSAIVSGNKLRDCAFGIWVHESPEVRLLNNRVLGRSESIEADRGNGIHLFDSSKAIVRGNFVSGARDGIYVSAVEDSLFEDNRVENQRYGIHYMFSYRNTLRRNAAVNNLTGLALMQSERLFIEDNEVRNNERHGILFRDAQYCKITGNTVVGNGEGFFFFSSTDNTIKNNLLKHNKIGARIWAGTLRNAIENNSFVGNDLQVFFVGAKDLVLGAGVPGNVWSDYLGWDQDGDGTGDRPHRLDSFTSTMIYKFPAAVMLLGSPTLELLSHLETRLPLLRVPTVVDQSPLIGVARP